MDTQVQPQPHQPTQSTCSISTTDLKSSLTSSEAHVLDEELWDRKPFICFSVMTVATIFIFLLAGYILSISVLHQVVSSHTLPNLFQINGATFTHLISRDTGYNELKSTSPKLLDSGDSSRDKVNSKRSILRGKRLDVYVTGYPENVSIMNVYTLDVPPSAITSVQWKWETGTNLTEFMEGYSQLVPLHDVGAKSGLYLRNGTRLAVKYHINHGESCDKCQVNLAIINAKEWTSKRKRIDYSTPGLLSVYSLDSQAGIDSELNIDINWNVVDGKLVQSLGFVLFYENYDAQRSKLSHLSISFDFSIPSFSIPEKYSKRYLNVKPETRIEDKKYLLLEYSSHNDNIGSPFLGKLKIMELAPESLLGILLAGSSVFLCLVIDLVLVLGYCYRLHVKATHKPHEEESSPLLPVVAKQAGSASVSTLGSTNQ